MGNLPASPVFIYALPCVVKSILAPGLVVCGPRRDFSGAGHPLPADVPRCACSLAPICTGFMDGYYIDLTQ